MNPLVSILVVTYNQEKFLKECLDSCIAQDYHPIEIIVTDDCSKDGTNLLLYDYKAKFPNIFKIIISSENMGVTKNHNQGLKLCKGKYIALLGGDDIMHYNKISSIINYMESDPGCSVCFHDMDVFDSKSNRSLYLYSSKNKSKNGSLSTILRHGSINCASGTVYRNSDVPTHGFRDELPVASDWMFTIESLSNGGSIKFIPKVLGRYRRHLNNVSNYNSSFRVQAANDLLRTCFLSLELYPQYSHCTIKRLSMILRESRLLNESKFYSNRILASIKAGGGLKSIICYSIYLLSFCKIKL